MTFLERWPTLKPLNYELKLHFHWKNSIECYSFVFCMHRGIRANFFLPVFTKNYVFSISNTTASKLLPRIIEKKVLRSYNYCIKKFFSINGKNNKKKRRKLKLLEQKRKWYNENILITNSKCVPCKIYSNANFHITSTN